MATPILRSFEIPGADGGPLRGDVRTTGDGAGRPAVVICHGFKGFKNWGFFPPLAERLARSGMTAVSFNFSGSGVGPDGESFSEPERFGHWTYANDLADVARVWTAVARGGLVPGLAPPTRAGLFGHSRGGGVAVLFASRHPDVAALVTWSAIGRVLRWGPETVARWRRDGKLDVVNQRTGQVLPLYQDVLDDIEQHRETYDIAAAAERVAAPWLIVHGETDETVPIADARLLSGRSAGRANLLPVPHASHTFGAKHPWGGTTPALDRALDATIAWFADALF